MRHRVAGRKLSRTKEHRLAMRRNMVASLIHHETISTTIEKAKEVKPFAEKLITMAKKGNLQSRRRAITMLGNRDMIDYEEGEAVKKGTVIGKLFSDIGPRYLDRPGGYTRIIRLPLSRIGDNGQLVLLQLIGADEKTKKQTKTSKTSKKKSEKKKIEETEQAPEIAEIEEPIEEENSPEPEESTEVEDTQESEEKSGKEQ